MTIVLRVEQEFEEALKLSWEIDPGFQGRHNEYEVEMVIDRSDRKCDDDRPLRPAPDAMVKRVPMGTDQSAFIQNMPTARNFLVSVVRKGGGQTSGEVRSPWVRAATLSPNAREKDMGNLDPLHVPRANCEKCTCPGYVPMRWSLNSAEKLRCRRCGCVYTDHVVVEMEAILKKRADKACDQLGKKAVKPLPKEALEWDERECNLWFWTDGQLHPRTTVGEHRPAVSADARVPAGGPEGLRGKKGRVSVVTPTIESRHEFHEQLWRCFEAQAWPDKELVVVETYIHKHSDFFTELARKDPRVVYVKFQRPPGQDWSIGLKRNIGTHLATGEFIANFDDDDLYAPVYLPTMISMLEGQAQAITLSSWFIFTVDTGSFEFCDPIAWGMAKGFDLDHEDVKHWAYGYGFSYVFRRKAGLEALYEDINLGEDFNFITQLQHRRGNSSVILFHDDFGICVHVQHGGNTSNSIPFRDVGLEEALDLEVMELAPDFLQRKELRSCSFFPAMGVTEATQPPSRRHRSVEVHTPFGDLTVKCAVSATASEFLRSLQEQMPDQGSKAPLRAYRVPPHGIVDEAMRDVAAIDVLGLRFLLEMPGAEENLGPNGHCGEQWRQLLEQARGPMRGRSRVGLRTKELWVRQQELGTDEHESEDEEKEEFVVVDVTCQRATVKKFFTTTGSARARLGVGGTVAQLRDVLGADLPPKARVMAEKPGVGLSTLQETDSVPDMVTLTDFSGRRNFYALFTRRECLMCLEMIRAFFGKPENQKKLGDIEEMAKGDEVRFSIIICKLLADETYPPILRRCDLPDDQQPLHLVMQAMSLCVHQMDLSMTWLETEVLMRNKVKIRHSRDICMGHFRRHGVEDIDGTMPSITSIYKKHSLPHPANLPDTVFQV
eukprot:CAMPEP_0179235234 /NCGR_PEP_ID=MMETSP0797-20121207/13302_1 /TAXON_ID=47934 /ORGANISM="Dinophysis acuminata, Strain DAEP01" /LENGTH=888 /DNA_ID=CAMNT_0020942443 /DNA_START=133 /DNA_END=2799 /DNA_ORIENTATION=+